MGFKLRQWNILAVLHHNVIQMHLPPTRTFWVPVRNCVLGYSFLYKTWVCHLEAILGEILCHINYPEGNLPRQNHKMTNGQIPHFTKTLNYNTFFKVSEISHKFSHIQFQWTCTLIWLTAFWLSTLRLTVLVFSRH